MVWAHLIIKWEGQGDTLWTFHRWGGHFPQATSLMATVIHGWAQTLKGHQQCDSASSIAKWRLCIASGSKPPKDLEAALLAKGQCPTCTRRNWIHRRSWKWEPERGRKNSCSCPGSRNRFPQKLCVFLWDCMLCARDPKIHSNWSLQISLHFWFTHDFTA